jgi:hypothetical protein
MRVLHSNDGHRATVRRRLAKGHYRFGCNPDYLVIMRPLSLSLDLGIPVDVRIDRGDPRPGQWHRERTIARGVV